MNGSRFVFLALCCGVAGAAPGCTQIAGLGGDYRHGTSGGSGALGGGAGLGGSSAGMGGTSAGTAGDSGAGGEGAAGSDGAGTSGSDAGKGGTSAGVGGSGAGRGGTSAGTGGDSVDVAGQGGEPSSAGGTAGNAASAGMSGSAGAGAAWVGPVRVGYSKFSDSSTDPDHANGSVPDVTFEKPPETREGDLMLAFFGVDHELYIDSAALEANHWTILVAEGGVGTDGQGTYLMSKFAEADEPDMIVFNGVNPALYGLQALLTVYRGVNHDRPVDIYDIAGTADEGADGVTRVSTPTPALTTTVPNCLLLAGLSPDSLVDSPVIVTWPDGFANALEVKNKNLPWPNGWANIYLAERPWEEPSTFPASSIVWDIKAGERYYGAVSFMLALAPEP